ncbi:MAG: sugar phosphorylase [Chloroflexi bacterium]|nr:sugar phosphorylase [Chloroflexota bacterium]
MTLTSERILEKLIFLYGNQQGSACYQQLLRQIADFRTHYPQFSRQPVDPANRVTERDIVLITYGDSLKDTGTAPLRVLHEFLAHYLSNAISTVHILPFFPYSSDDGFSVIDYLAINADLGEWKHIDRLGKDFKLMFDGVINHVSAHSVWFKRFLEDDPAYREFFITVDPSADLSAVVRPRTLPLLTRFETKAGPRHVWTTFSDDQIDLNFAHPDVLLKIVDMLLFYIAHGARLIRLDAIAYLWKTIGTSCIHLPETHTIIQLFRDILDQVAPGAALITETNVPHAENVSYFGDGTNEAQLVYQFTLPPLLLYTFAKGDATVFSDWAAGLEKVSDQTTFFNFTASHDGIGVRPVEGILPPHEIAALAARTQQHGGDVSFKANQDGSSSPYELNINYFDALSDPGGNEPLELQARRFLAAQAIQLAFIGVPGIYIHSLLGSRNWKEGVTQTGRLRTINREKLERQTVEAALDDLDSLRSRVFFSYQVLISRRRAEKAFHPNGPQQVLRLHPAAVTLLRTSPDGREHIVAIHNVANQTITLDLAGVPLPGVDRYRDVISDRKVEAHAPLELQPYAILWLKAQ